ncbi:signal peptidase I [Kitasatospora sp. NPDC051853]|uniref:signal peptidase I n=1 Tax=Kitasatospora sp. NPDC051853 TaxID=3364058 RepID=UPI0037BB852B
MGERGRGRASASPPGAGISAGIGATAGTGALGDGPQTTSATGGTASASAPAPRGRAERRRSARRAARRRRRSLLREVPLIGVVAVLIALALKTFAVQVFVIPSGSMEQTIQIGDRVLVDKFTPWFGNEPSRGEVVVFKDPGGWLEPLPQAKDEGAVLRTGKRLLSHVGLLPSDDEQDLIKRVIGVPGDTIECCEATGRLTVNGVPLDEPYLAPGNAPSKQPFKVTVPPGRLWVMGDHRELSADSRYHLGEAGQGTIPMDNVLGRAFVIAWPLQRMSQLDVPETLSALPVHAGAGERSVPGAGGGTSAPDGTNLAGAQPDPAKPPLVMGVLGFLPALVRPRRARDRDGPSVR